MESLAWCEISRSALSHNLAAFRQLIGSDRLLAPVVKADGIVDRAPKLGATYRVPLGLASVATGLLHFLLPGVSLL